MSGSTTTSRDTFSCFANILLSAVRYVVGLLVVTQATPLRAEPDPVLEYQRVITPAQLVPSLATDHRPVLRSDFLQRMERLELESLGYPSVRIATAHYFARLQPSALTEGRGRWHIVAEQDGPGSLPVPLDIPLTTPRWVVPREATAEIMHSPQGARLLVPHGGDMEFDWSLTASSPSSPFEFALRFPSAVQQRLWLDLPATWVPHVDEGIATLHTDYRAISPEEYPLQIAPEYQLWEIRWPTARASRLILRDRASDAPRRRGVPSAWSSKTTYHVDQSGVDVEVELTLEQVAPPRETIDLHVDGAMTLRDIYVDGRPVEWAWERSESEGPTRLVQIVTPPTGPPPYTCELTGMSPFPSSPTTLPRIGLATGQWLASTYELRVAPALHLHEFSTIGMTPGLPAAGEQGEEGSFSVNLAALAEAATIELSCGRPRLEPRVMLAHHVRFRDDVMRCETVVSAERLRPGQRVEFTLGDGWLVESVSNGKSNASADWSTYEEAQRRRLSLATSPNADLEGNRWTVSARYQPDVLQSLQINALRPIYREQAVNTHEVVALDVPPGFGLRATIDHAVRWIDVSNIPESWSMFITAQPSTRILEILSSETSATVSVVPDAPRFRADIQLIVDSRGSDVTQEVWIRCVPESAALSRLEVETRPMTSPWRWYRIEETGDRHPPADAFRPSLGDLKADQQPLVATQQESTSTGWQSEAIVLEPQNRPFWLVGRIDAISNATDVALQAVRVPFAAEQRATISWYRHDGWDLSGTDPLIQLPPDPLAGNGRAGNLPNARFRYDPMVDGDRLDLQLTRRADAVDAQSPTTRDPASWIWSRRLVAQIYEDGLIDHLVTYYVACFGFEPLDLYLPSAAVIHRVAVDGQEVKQTPGTGSGAPIRVPLPAGPAYATVSLRYELLHSPLTVYDTVAVSGPITNIPTLATHDTVLVPPRFSRIRADRDANWLSRLAGPLAGRPDSTGPRWAFWELPRRRPRDLTADGQQEAFRLIDHLGDTVSQMAASPPRWRNLLTSLGDHFPQLRVDPAALRRVGVEPDQFATPVPSTSSPRGDGLRLLSQYRLVLLYSEHELTLSDEAFAAALPRSHRRHQSGRLYQALDRSTTTTWLGNTRTTGLTQPDRVGSVPPSSWSHDQWPFIDSAVDSPQVFTTAAIAEGWRATVMPVLSGEPSILPIWRPGIWGTAGWLAMLMSASIHVRLRTLAPQSRHSITLGLLAAALFCPPWVVPTASGTWLGWLAGYVIRFNLGTVRSTPHPAPTTVALLLVSGWLAVATPSALGQFDPRGILAQGDASHGTAQSRPFQVLFPQENDGNEPATRYVYVPNAMYRQMVRHEQRTLQGDTPWSLLDAHYHLLAEYEEMSWRIADASAELTLQTTLPHMRIPLPFQEREINLVGDGVEIDQITRTAEWDSEEHLSLQIADPGRHSVRFRFVPRQPWVGVRQGAAFSIPRVLNSECTMQVVGGQRGLNRVNSPIVCSTALGASRWDADDLKLQTLLGPSDRLHVHLRPDYASHQATGTVTQHIDVQAFAEAIRLVVTTSWQLTSSSATHLDFDIDPRWQLLGVDAPPSTHVVRATNRRVVIESDSPLPTTGTVEFRFVLPQSPDGAVVQIAPLVTPSCEMAPPTLSILQGEAELVWADERAMIRTTKPATEHNTSLTTSAPTLNNGYVQLPIQPTTWRIARRQVAPAMLFERKMNYILRRDNMTAELDIDIDAPHATTFFHRITLAEDWTVTSVVAVDDGNEIPLEWTQHDDGGSLFLWSRRAWGPRLKIIVEAAQPIAVRGSVTLPTFGPGKFTWQSDTATVWIDEQFDATVTTLPDGVETKGGPLPETLRDGLHHVATWHQDGRVHQLAWSPNDASAEGYLVTHLRRSFESWHAIIEGDVRVTNGRYDTIQLDIPAGWVDHITDSTLPWTLHPASHRGRRLISLPSTGSRQRFAMRVALPPSDGPDFILPSIGFQQIKPVGMYVTVPGDPWQWRPQRMVPIPELPPSFTESNLPSDTLRVTTQVAPGSPTASSLTDNALPAGTLIYQATSPEHQLEGRPAEAVGPSATAVLADAHLRLCDGNVARGLIHFDLTGTALPACRIRSPSSVKIIQVLVDQRPAISVQHDGQDLVVGLGHSSFPREISLLFEAIVSRRNLLSRLVGDTGGIVQLPELRRTDGTLLRPEHTLWCVSGSPGRTMSFTQGRTEQVEQRLVRLSAMQRLMKETREMQGGVDDKRRWFAAWYPRWRDNLAAPLPATITAQQRLAWESFEQIDRVERNAWTGVSSEIDDPVAVTSSDSKGGVTTLQGLDAALVARTQHAPPILYGTATGWQAQFAIPRYLHDMSGDRYATRILLWLCAAAIVFLPRIAPQAIGQSLRNLDPAWLGVAVGTGWGLLLYPAYLGWLIVAAAILALARRHVGGIMWR